MSTATYGSIVILCAVAFLVATYLPRVAARVRAEQALRPDPYQVAIDALIAAQKRARLDRDTYRELHR